jgi:hypothetical protein
MPFIELTDYKAYIKEANLLNMIDSDTAARTQAEDTAIEEVKQYLYERYDTEVIFALTGGARNLHILRLVIYCALYILHDRLPNRVTPESVIRNYENAREDMAAISNGNISLNAPRRSSTTEGDATGVSTRFRWGGNEQRDLIL